THHYLDSETFPISVTINRGSESPRVAWSLARVAGTAAPRHLPPFAQAHLSGYWVFEPNSDNSLDNEPHFYSASVNGKTQMIMSGQFVFVNSGNKPAPPSKIKFYLSSDSTLSDDDQQIAYNGFDYFSVPAVAPGQHLTATFAQIGNNDF